MKPFIFAALAAAEAPAWAQQKPEIIIITGNPLGSREVAAPASVLSGQGLVLRRGSSLGETLDGLPGVSSSYFGPNANRPVIRGQDGDRIRVLSDAGAALDASSLSFRHAVPIDPLVVERIEVLRGPAALLYGGSAVGGVVNAIDNQVKVGVFQSRFSNYIVLQSTGEPDFVTDEGHSFPVFAFRDVRAKLYGLELEGTWRVLDGTRSLDVDVKLDVVRGSNADSGEPLPRLAPRRATLGVNLLQGAWTLRAEALYASAQLRVPSTDGATAGWTLVNLSASYALNLGAREALLFAKLQNVGNKLAYSASTIGTVRALSPMPGRGLTAGLRVPF